MTAPRSRRRLPPTLLKGRVRTSTVLVSVAFLALLALYVVVRPVPGSYVDTDGTVVTPQPSRFRTSASPTPARTPAAPEPTTAAPTPVPTTAAPTTGPSPSSSPTPSPTGSPLPTPTGTLLPTSAPR